jgi:hypothetical protein
MIGKISSNLAVRHLKKNPDRFSDLINCFYGIKGMTTLQASRIQVLITAILITKYKV